MILSDGELVSVREASVLESRPPTKIIKEEADDLEAYVEDEHRKASNKYTKLFNQNARRRILPDGSVISPKLDSGEKKLSTLEQLKEQFRDVRRPDGLLVKPRF